MKKQIDNFLLGLLWLLAMTLGANFWFTTRFGFNLFSGAHWQYLGQLQASRININSMFYISMVVIVFVMIYGLYLIVRPRFRRIKLATKQTDTATPTKKEVPTPAPQIKPEQPKPAPVAAQRPPRLLTPKVAATAATQKQTVAPAPIPTQTTNTSAPNADFADIEKTFIDAGFVVKKPPKIGGLRPALFAIGTDEVLWVGAVGVEPDKLNDSVQKLDKIFTETLEDIKITINAFVLNPKSDASNIGNVKTFDSISDLREFVMENKNRPVMDEEREDFDAYSDYIDTVANYFNKM